MTKKMYESIPESSTNTMDDFPRERAHRNNDSMLKGASVVIVGCLLVAIVTFYNPTNSSLRQASLLQASTSDKGGNSRSCTFAECFETHCDPDSAPFTCVRHNGGPHGGCSVVPWTKESCEDSCDLSGCADLDIPDDTKGCAGVQCSPEWCLGAQICPQDVPYQCTVGAACFGCSTDTLHWTLRSDDSTCSSCCDTTTC